MTTKVVEDWSDEIHLRSVWSVGSAIECGQQATVLSWLYRAFVGESHGPTLTSHIFISTLFLYLGLPNFLESDILRRDTAADADVSASSSLATRHRDIPLWAVLFKELLPVVKTSFVPGDLQETINERLWASASAIPDFYGEIFSD
ncbi:hypothetical protein V6N12_021826 [Hibiscus sabdariffa]|uniref:Uncharacterized protein n=1 Tax=Hibiscus sabdariffa TaxID=183260 RepID=A0ABR2FSU3_9ROSI